MSKGWKIAVITIGALVGISLLVGAGILIGRKVVNRNIDYRLNAMGRGGYPVDPRNRQDNWFARPGLDNIGPGMMDRSSVHQGMRGQFWNKNFTGTPLTVETAKTTVEDYLTTFNNSDLYVKEVMVFNNNAYAVIAESSTGKGAMEVLVDPATRNVIPEIGPNMMWNTKYGHMSNANFRRSQMGLFSGYNNNQLSTAQVTENTVTAEQALQYAQSYLDTNVEGATIAEDAIAFYGYYSMDYLVDGKPAGMLSVNGFTGQVWLHTWHGTFIEEWESQ